VVLLKISVAGLIKKKAQVGVGSQGLVGKDTTTQATPACRMDETVAPSIQTVCTVSNEELI